MAYDGPFLFRLVQKEKVKHPIREKNGASANTSVRNAKGNGCRVIRGRTWAKNASNAALMFTRTSNGPWKNRMVSTFRTNRRSILRTCARSVTSWAITAEGCSNADICEIYGKIVLHICCSD